MMRAEPVRRNELEAALQLIFQHLPANESAVRVANAMELVRQGDMDREGILVVRRGATILGAIVCTTTPGAGGLVWPPQARADCAQVAVEDSLVRAAITRLEKRGAKLAQALLAGSDNHLGPALTRNGFTHVTSLWYLRHNLELAEPLLRSSVRLEYQSYAACDRGLFHRTLLATYEATMDCPEVNNVRTIDDIIEGHKSQGIHDPTRWQLAWHEGAPIGVLVLTEVPEWEGWDLAYLGVVPQARGRGLGRELTLKAIYEAKIAEQSQLTLSVDARNRPAWHLYQKSGFEPFDQREVYLAILNTPLE